jgi:hypothetical protein
VTRRLPILLALAALLATLAATPATPQTATTDIVLAAGDIAPATNSRVTADYATSEEVLRQLNTHPDARVLIPGDIQYEVGALDAFQSELGYDGSWGRFKNQTCPVAGNHEYLTAGAPGFFGYFTDQLQACATSGHPDRGYYAFNLPNSGWRWYMLSSDCARNGGSPDCRIGSAQDQWLAADLAANAGRRCIGAVWHHPRWGSGAPFNDDLLMTTFWNRLNHVHADLVIVGHEHAYARFGPMRPGGTLSPTGEGIRQILIGTGGRSLIPFNSTTARTGTRYRDASHFGILKLTLSPGAWASQFVRTDGQIADSVSAGCWA